MTLTRAAAEAKKLNIEVIPGDEFIWVHVQKPTAAEVNYLAERFPQLHPLNLEDILSRHRAKIDEYPDHLFVVLEFPVPREETQGVIPNVLNAFIGKDFLVTVDYLGRFLSINRLLQSCQTDDESRKDAFGKGPGYLFYRLIDYQVDRRMERVGKIGEEIQALEDAIFSPGARGLVRRISTLRGDIISLWQIMWPMRDTIRNLELKIQRYARMDARAYFGDLNDHLNNIWDALCEYKEIIEGLQEAYSSLASYQLNDILRVLTIIMTIGTVLTVVVGFFGMNIPLNPLGSDPGGHGLAWVLLLFLSLLITGIMLLYFWRKGWL